MNREWMKLAAALAAFWGAWAPSSGLPQAQQDAAALEEILVTARRQEIALQKAPVAVSVLSGEDFDKSGIVKLDNFNGYVPGLVVAKNDGAGRIAAIRGIGWETAQNLASQPSVLSYIDGVYLANPLALGLDLGELERIEVFRGPQGTEFGQGTTGGAINLVTKKPRLGERFGELDLSYGTFDAFQGRAAFNLPLGEALALRASAQRYRRDGFAEIQGGALDGYELDDADSTLGKIALLWQPGKRFSALAQAFVHGSDQHAAAQKEVSDPIADARRLSQDYPGIFALDNRSASLILTWEAAPGLTLKSLSGWQELRKRQSKDNDRLTEALTSINRLGFSFDNWDIMPFWDNDSDAVSQELSLSWQGERLDWALGGYYLDHRNFNHFLEATGAAPFAESPASRPRAELTEANLPPYRSDLNFTEVRTLTRKDHALYGRATYRLNGWLALTGGLRYQAEDQADQVLQLFGLREGRIEADDSHISWKLGLDAQLDADHLLYGSASTGWKNGGANPGAVNAVLMPIRFGAEKVTAFELGSRNAFLDGRARLNLTAFYYDHRNLQFTYEDPRPFAGGSGVAPKSEEYGLEAEFNWLLSDDWRLDGMLAAQDGRVKSDLPALDVVDFRQALRPFELGLFTPNAVDERTRMAAASNLKGNKPPKLVDLTARLALTHKRRFAEGSLLTSRLEYIHRGEFQARIYNNPLTDAVPAYDIVNLHFAFDWGRRPLSLSLSLTNLFDRDGINNIFVNPYGLWTASAEFIPPREILASIKFRLNG